MWPLPQSLEHFLVWFQTPACLFVLTCLCSLSQWLNVRIRESNKSQLEGCSFLVFHSMFFFLYFSLAETSSLSGVLVLFSRCANKHAIFSPHFVWCMHVPQVVMPGSMICNVTFLVTCFTCLASSWTFFYIYILHLLQHESFCSVSFNFVFVPDRQHSLNFSLVLLCFS